LRENSCSRCHRTAAPESRKRRPTVCRGPAPLLRLLAEASLSLPRPEAGVSGQPHEAASQKQDTPRLGHEFWGRRLLHLEEAPIRAELYEVVRRTGRTKKWLLDAAAIWQRCPDAVEGADAGMVAVRSRNRSGAHDPRSRSARLGEHYCWLLASARR